MMKKWIAISLIHLQIVLMIVSDAKVCMCTEAIAMLGLQYHS